jgi:Zn-dependent protease
MLPMFPDFADRIGPFVIWYVVFLFTLTLHEAAHALVAWLGGDATAYRGGQVTLNPIPHVRREPLGTIVVPLLTFFSAGWMMGWASAPYDPEWGRRHPKRQALMAAAGPAANFLLVIIAFIAIRILLGAGILEAPQTVRFDQLVVAAEGTPEGSLLHPFAFFLSVAINLNLLLFLFNLLPLPPLDGSGVLQGVAPDTFGRLFDSLVRNPMFSLVGLVLAWQVFPHLYRPAFDVLLSLLHPGYVYR